MKTKCFRDKAHAQSTRIHTRWEMGVAKQRMPDFIIFSKGMGFMKRAKKRTKYWIVLILAVTLVGSNALYQLGTFVSASEVESGTDARKTDGEEIPGTDAQEAGAVDESVENGTEAAERASDVAGDVEQSVTVQEIFRDEDEETPLTNNELGHPRCIFHFFVLLAAAVILIVCTSRLKRKKRQILALRKELNIELAKHGRPLYGMRYSAAPGAPLTRAELQ